MRPWAVPLIVLVAASAAAAGALSVGPWWSYPRTHLFHHARYCTMPDGRFPMQPCAVFEDAREVIAL